MIRIWAIFRSPEGAPAAFLVQPIDCIAGGPERRGSPIFASTIELAREAFPSQGLKRRDPRNGEPPELVETWEPVR